MFFEISEHFLYNIWLKFDCKTFSTLNAFQITKCWNLYLKYFVRYDTFIQQYMKVYIKVFFSWSNNLRNSELQNIFLL